jgi:peptidylprolyl isomerase
MPKTKRTTRTSRRAAKTQQNRRMWIIIAIAILVLAVAISRIMTAQRPAPAVSGEMPELVSANTYSGPPPMLIDTSKEYTATVKMEKGGEFVIQFYPEQAPITVNSFVFLAREGFYDGVTFHRVLDGFMAQGGDPTGTGGGGPGYKFVNEDSELRFDKPVWSRWPMPGVTPMEASSLLPSAQPRSWMAGILFLDR